MKRFLKLFLVLVMLIPYLLRPVGGVHATSEVVPSIENMIEVVDEQYNVENLEIDSVTTETAAGLDFDEQELAELNALVGTLGEPLGMQGFYGDYALDDPNEVVEIIVQFVTPPAVALRLMQERELSQARVFSDDNFKEHALMGHENFNAQLQQIPVAFSEEEMEIFATHYWLFNGVFMRLPGHMVEQVATLPEVFSVTPHTAFYLVDDPIIEEIEVEEDNINEASGDMRTSLFASDNLLREARAYFNMNYVHHTLGITGSGVRVAVLDTGIDHSHPEFARFLDDTGRVPGHHFYDNSPALSPSGAVIPLNTSHGTTVSGIVVGMAPNIELWHYRVGVVGSTGGSIFGAIETAHRDASRDEVPLVINLSLGAPGTPFSGFANILNLLSLDGTVVVGSAGNSVGFFGGFSDSYFLIVDPGAASLAISVGGGTAGGIRTDDTIAHFPPNWASSRGPLLDTYHIKPDIIVPGAGLRTTTLNGGYALMSHTSSSAPFAAGLAALMVEAFPDATPQEIRARMMNTARPFRDNNANRVFRAGAGFVRPVEAVTNESFVTVEHLIPLTSNRNAPFEMGIMASFSFGELRSLITNHANAYEMTATITNDHQTAQTYTIDYYFTNNPNNMATLSFDRQNVTVDPNHSATFTVTLSMREGFIPEGFYEGYVNVRSGDEVVARLPFALVNTADLNFNPQIVTFDLAGGHVGGELANIELMVNQDDAIGLANVPIVLHDNGRYFFVGWQENGTGEVLTRGQVGEQLVTNSRTFRAVWEPITEWEQLRQHIAGLPTGGHTIRLTQDILASNPVTGVVGTAITILAGREITLESSTSNIQTLLQINSGQRHFIVNNNATLTLGSNITLSGGVENNTTNSGGIQVNAGGTLIMEDGSIIENSHRTINGGAVTITGTNARFEMNGGVIRNNSSPSGGGINIGVNAHFEMSGGYIRENRSTAAGITAGGGGISQIGGTVTITDGTIRRNTATNQGGGVRVSVATTNAFTMTGGTISHNTATTGDGGGLFTTVHTYQSPLPAGMHYTNINIGADVNFSDNIAGGGAFMPPSNAATATHIATTATRSGGLAHALNNLDINFRGGVRIQLHTVRFLDGETLVDSVEIQEGEQLTTADIPTDLNREGYEFMGWSHAPGGAAQTLIGTTITSAVDFHAVWQPIYVPVYVSYTFNWGLEGITNPTGEISYNGTPVAPLTMPSNPSYTFEGWNPEVGPITEDTTFTAVWTPTVLGTLAIMNHTVPFRSGPNASYASLGDATQGTRVMVLDTLGIWTQIRIGDQIGWVQGHRHNYLIENEAPYTAIMNHTIPLRSGPNGSYPSPQNATQGTRITVLGTSTDGTWSHIQIGNRTGWVMSHRHSRLIENEVAHLAVMNHTIPLRSGPGASYASLQNATLGTRITVLGTSVNGEWSHIQIGTQAGWVMSHRHTPLVGVMNHTVPLRGGPGATYESLGDAMQGTRVVAIVTSADGSWTQIQIGERTGWVLNHRLSAIALHESPYSAAMNHTIPFRSGPNGSYASLKDATQGMRIMVFGTSIDGSWSNIQIGDQVGWVMSHRLNYLIENEVPQPAMMHHTVPLRSGPNGSYTQLGNATEGASVMVLGTSVNGEWTHIQIGTRIGWVMSHRLS